MLAISSRKSVPPSASSKQPTRSALRVGERALHVAEQLALEDALGQPAGVDRARAACSRAASRVQPAGDDLLAGAVLAGDEHVRVRRGRPARSAGAPAASRATRRSVGGSSCSREQRVLASSRWVRRSARPSSTWVRSVASSRALSHGFCDVVARAAAHRLDRALDAAPGGHHHAPAAWRRARGAARADRGPPCPRWCRACS